MNVWQVLTIALLIWQAILVYQIGKCRHCILLLIQWEELNSNAIKSLIEVNLKEGDPNETK